MDSIILLILSLERWWGSCLRIWSIAWCIGVCMIGGIIMFLWRGSKAVEVEKERWRLMVVLEG